MGSLINRQERRHDRFDNEIGSSQSDQHIETSFQRVQANKMNQAIDYKNSHDSILKEPEKNGSTHQKEDKGVTQSGKNPQDKKNFSEKVTELKEQLQDCISSGNENEKKVVHLTVELKYLRSDLLEEQKNGKDLKENQVKLEECFSLLNKFQSRFVGKSNSFQSKQNPDERAFCRQNDLSNLASAKYIEDDMIIQRKNQDQPPTNPILNLLNSFSPMKQEQAIIILSQMNESSEPEIWNWMYKIKQKQPLLITFNCENKQNYDISQLPENSLKSIIQVESHVSRLLIQNQVIDNQKGYMMRLQLQKLHVEQAIGFINVGIKEYNQDTVLDIKEPNIIGKAFDFNDNQQDKDIFDKYATICDQYQTVDIEFNWCIDQKQFSYSVNGSRAIDLIPFFPKQKNESDQKFQLFVQFKQSNIKANIELYEIEIEDIKMFSQKSIQLIQ